MIVDSEQERVSIREVIGNFIHRQTLEDMVADAADQETIGDIIAFFKTRDHDGRALQYTVVASSQRQRSSRIPDSGIHQALLGSGFFDVAPHRVLLLHNSDTEGIDQEALDVMQIQRIT